MPKLNYPADRELDTIQKELDTCRTEADELIHEIADPLRFALRKSTASNQRRIMLPMGLAIAIYSGKKRMKKKQMNSF